MKKWLIIVVVLIGLLVTYAYVFLPKNVNSSIVVKIHCVMNSASRYVMNETKWPKWWPGTIIHDSVSNKDIFNYEGCRYLITEIKYNAILIETQANGFSISGTMIFLPLNPDSIQVEWKYGLETTANPINRLHLYWESKKINNNLLNIMKSMKAFLDKPENVYGMHIDQILVKDTLLVTTNFSSPQYPTTQKIYDLINGIKTYIALNHAKETNFPMLHIWQDSGIYKSQVAIPVNVVIPQNHMYLIKRMVPGKILVGQVTGGAYTANEAIRQMGIFMTDHALSSPAIPFESLVTNRMEEPDTSKWITKIYYPVF
ncbi:hypothetical protein FW778_15615 [Ginsengibacter hankyongi]|uniref:Bacterial transcription activator effector binding domain-containing protein n=1 Tax=Ginsengibacter hankyongi TaxID=2607284 RepID=A0A5J5IEN8_9BACT|nr:hypothetical protein [Ginsengibacter hankyongi]KAA9038176.1 hypothetical protein FW778_15615 [Ginsengibacter hankyongi]